jgi:hypothetical protein
LAGLSPEFKNANLSTYSFWGENRKDTEPVANLGIA